MKAARAEVRRLNNVASKLMDLIISLEARRKALEEEIAVLEIMRNEAKGQAQACLEYKNGRALAASSDSAFEGY